MRAAMLVALLLLPALAGCLEGPRTPSEIEAEEGLIAPPWEVGDWWLYTFVTPEFGEDSARLVVADEDPVDGQWMLGSPVNVRPCATRWSTTTPSSAASRWTR